MKKKTKKKVISYSIYFIIFSFLGSLIESIFGLITGQGALYFYKSLFMATGLKIPFLPLYGLVGISLLSLQKFLDKKKVPVCTWGLINALVITSYELLFGILGLITFGELVWDYSANAINFMGIISLNMSLLWLIAGYLFSIVYLYFRPSK